MTRLCLLFTGILSLAVAVTAQAQPFGNEWIRYNRVYLKLQVLDTGMYRISYSTLAAGLSSVGLNIATTPRRSYQIHRRGVEQALFIPGGGTSLVPLAPVDFIEFYGLPNDAGDDSLMYYRPLDQFNPWYPIHSDTAAYFLSVDPDLSMIGKRMQVPPPDVSFSIPAEPWQWEQRLIQKTQRYSIGAQYPLSQTAPGLIKPTLTLMDQGEGYMSAFQDLTFNFDSLRFLFTADTAARPRLQLVLVGQAYLPSYNYEILVGPSPSALRSVHLGFLNYFSIARVQVPLLFSDISTGGNLVVQVVERSLNGRLSLSWGALTYATLPNQAGSASRRFQLRPSVSAPFKAHWQTTTFPTQHTLYEIPRPDSLVIRLTTVVGSTLQVVLPDNQSGKTLFLRDNTGWLPVTQLIPVRFRRLDLNSPSYVLISHPVLRASVPGIGDPVQAYATYRASIAGGAYDTCVVMTQELFDSYGYGDFNPVAIKRFVKHMQSLGGLMHVFIVGKGYFTRLRSSAALQVNNLVPGMGFPGSDNIYGMGLRTHPDSLEVSIGRISARTSQEVAQYLQKVIDQESQPKAQRWRKSVLHLAGGRDPQESSLFRSWMDSYAETAKRPLLGGQVRLRSKETGNTVEFINIAEQINAGQLLVNIFAHSNINFIDIDIGAVDNPVNGYANTGKYPAFLISGCNSGSLFGDQQSWGEPWVLAAQKGALHFLAHADQGFTISSDRYVRSFYDTAFLSPVWFGKAIGSIAQQTSLRVMQFTDPSILQFGTYAYYRAQVEQMVLQGDPAVRLFHAELPDLAIVPGSVSLRTFDGSVPTATKDSLVLKFRMTNYGRALTDSFTVSLKRRVGGADLGLPTLFRLPPLLFEDSAEVVLRQMSVNTAGLNSFELRLDPEDSIEEITKANNTALLEYNLPQGGAKPLWPKEFSIVGTVPVLLSVQSSVFTGAAQTFLLEADTTYEYSSPIKKDTVLHAVTLGEWALSFPNPVPDSTVVFWRVKLLQPPPGVDTTFASSSFTVLNGSPGGWSQTGFDQARKNRLQGLDRSFSTKWLNFEATQLTVELRVAGGAVASASDSTRIRINGDQFLPITGLGGTGCGSNSLLFLAFDRSTAQPYSILTGFPNGFVLCGKPPGIALRVNPASATSDLTALMQSLRTGDRVVMFTNGSVDVSLLDPNAIQLLTQLGISSNQLSFIGPGAPAIFLGAKGAAAGTAQVWLADTLSPTPVTEQMFSVTIPITGSRNRGIMESTIIGPVSEWGTLYHRISAQDGDDRFSVKVVGLDSLGSRTVLIDSALSGTSLTFVSPLQYPFIRLEAYLEDTSFLTAPVWRKWLITYRGIPEAVALGGPLMQYVTQEGTRIGFQARFRNISQEPFAGSTLVVRVRLDQLGIGQTLVRLDTISAPAPGAEVVWSDSVDTRGRPQTNRYSVFFNPRILPETEYGNNLLTSTIEVTQDTRHPLLDVTVDGRRLMNGDLVSPRPEIRVRLQDDNMLLNLGDTALVELLHKRPCRGCAFVRIPYVPGVLEIIGGAQGQVMEVQYRPELLEDGIHTLAVQGRDATGNRVAEQPYSIQFEVVNESSITHFYPYPNPFSSSCRFVFTLTGSELPDQLMIRILTVSGRVVREIGLAEFGPIRIGHNQSIFAWDGTDQFGDQLANGVYLYHVAARKSGKDIKHRNSAGDGAFRNDYGKLYLLR